MRIWTIQPVEVYETLKSKRMLWVDGRQCDRNWPHAYRWMIDQMRRRLPPSRARFPWWGWYRWHGVRRSKPDLRAWEYLPAGQRSVRIELDLEDREVLLSDYDGWHYALNDWFLSFDEAEDDRFDEEKRRLGYQFGTPYPEPLRAQVLTSWERIFDLTGGNPEWYGQVSERSIQATFWELRLRDVTDVTLFTARWQSS
jgi:hypothetical protein